MILFRFSSSQSGRSWTLSPKLKGIFGDCQTVSKPNVRRGVGVPAGHSTTPSDELCVPSQRSLGLLTSDVTGSSMEPSDIKLHLEVFTPTQKFISRHCVDYILYQSIDRKQTHDSKLSIGQLASRHDYACLLPQVSAYAQNRRA